MSGDYPGNARKRRVTMTVEPFEPEIVGAASNRAGCTRCV
jgi:hypothetical protein